MTRVVAFGECMLELQGAPFGAMRQGQGGDTLNIAVYLARCGARHGLQVDYATALGDDPLSDGLLARWQAEGLGTGLVRRLAGRLPGLYLIALDAHGERSFHYWRGEAAARGYFDTAPGATPLEAQAAGIHLLVLSGISLAILPEAGRERLAALVQQLRQRGGRLAFDNNHRPRLWPDADSARRWNARFTALADMALLTLDDEMLLWGERDAERQLQATLALPVPELVVKRGAQPTVVRLAGQAPQQLLTEAVPRVVDSTAAGDAFAGAYLAARLGGADALAAAAAGNRLAARVVQQHGALIDRALMHDLMA